MTPEQIAGAEAIRMTRSFALQSCNHNLYLHCWLMTAAEIQIWHLKNLYLLRLEPQRESATSVGQAQIPTSNIGEDSFAEPDA